MFDDIEKDLGKDYQECTPNKDLPNKGKHIVRGLIELTSLGAFLFFSDLIVTIHRGSKKDAQQQAPADLGKLFGQLGINPPNLNAGQLGQFNLGT